MNFKIGGEIPLQQDGLYSYITDSGRSSLRLILNTLKDKKFALPDFLCPVIIDVFYEMAVEYEFYHVEKNFDFILPDLDVLYVIDYFGRQHWFHPKAPFIISDMVFSPQVIKLHKPENWIGFNSLRKISPLTDGSIVKSTFHLHKDLIDINWSALFTGYKSNNKFEEGEEILTKQKKIYRISNHSLFALFDFYYNLENERRDRQNNFNTLKTFLNIEQLEIQPEFPSFFPILIDKRDELREWLRTQNIFLPVHWPKHPKAPDNPLYDRIISIPVDSRYTIVDMERVAGLINGFYNV